MMDRRVDPRVEIRLPCHVSLLGNRSRLFVGVTENISRSGILVGWNSRVGSEAPKPGDVLTLEIELPASHSFGRKCIHCQVTAVRVSEPGAGDPLVAFQINQMRFRDAAAKLVAAESRPELSGLVM